MRGLPYLRNSSIGNFIINIIFLLLVQKYGNFSQKSRKRDSGTFYFEATCVRLLMVALLALLGYPRSPMYIPATLIWVKEKGARRFQINKLTTQS